jgi:hypothetical protein
MLHVCPINDTEEHDTESTTCWCVPEITEEYGQIIIIHNAFDGRTLKEKQDENIHNNENTN